MSKCDNWEERQKMLEENGLHLHKDDIYGFCYEISGYRYTVEGLKAMSDSRFIDLLEIKSPTDAINHPACYTDGKIEVSDFIADKNLNFFRGNVLKYICRAGKKDPDKEIEDLKKAEWYLNREIDRLEWMNK